MFNIMHERGVQRGPLKIFVTAPFIYGMYIPLVIIDLSTRVYHAFCFRIYGISLVDRSRYVRPGNRGRMSATLIDRIHCYYCGYATGVIQYVQEVLIQTERYWCPIRHAPSKGYKEPPHQKEFPADGDEAGLHARITAD